MAKKNNNNTTTTKKVDTQKPTEKKTVEKKFKHKVKIDCGFKSRNYYINSRNVLLIAGEGIEEEDYNCFSEAAKEKYFTTS